MTEAHLAVGKKVAAFRGYTTEMQEHCALVGAQYIRDLTALRATFMSKALIAVGNPSNLGTVVAAPGSAAAPSSPHSGSTELETGQPSEDAEDLEENLAEEEWETGEGWEIPQM